MVDGGVKPKLISLKFIEKDYRKIKECYNRPVRKGADKATRRKCA